MFAIIKLFHPPSPKFLSFKILDILLPTLIKKNQIKPAEPAEPAIAIKIKISINMFSLLNIYKVFDNF